MSDKPVRNMDKKSDTPDGQIYTRGQRRLVKELTAGKESKINPEHITEFHPR